MRSKHRDEAFRRAARQQCDDARGWLSVDNWANVERIHGGGAFVEVKMWVPEQAADRAAAALAVEAQAEAAAKAAKEQKG